MRHWRERGYETVLVGDGLSDRCGAREADRVIARGDLLDWCAREGLAARPFRDFADVAALAREWAGHEPARARSSPAPGGRRGLTASATLTAMRIGDVLFDSPFLLAPLAGVSDSPFRRLAREQGASGVVTEMVSADGLVRGQQATLEYLRFEPEERPIGVQLFGADPGIMADAARALCACRRRSARTGSTSTWAARCARW